MVFYYYYDHLCKAININPHVTRKVTDTYGKIMHFVADRHHIYLQPCAQQGDDKHIGYYQMTQEDIEQVIKDQPEIWVVSEENPQEKKKKEKEKGKGKEKEKEQDKELAKDQEKDKEKEQDKGMVALGEKRPSTTNTSSSPRKKRKSSKPTYQVVLHDDDPETIVDRVSDNMYEPITTFKTTQEGLKQMIEVQFMELKTLVSHTPQVTTPAPVHSAVLETQGNRHQFVSVTLINICQPNAQEGLQEGAMQLELVVLPLETLRTLQAQIAEEFNDKEKLVRNKNVALRQE